MPPQVGDQVLDTLPGATPFIVKSLQENSGDREHVRTHPSRAAGRAHSGRTSGTRGRGHRPDGLRAWEPGEVGTGCDRGAPSAPFLPEPAGAPPPSLSTTTWQTGQAGEGLPQGTVCEGSHRDPRP